MSLLERMNDRGVLPPEIMALLTKFRKEEQNPRGLRERIRERIANGAGRPMLLKRLNGR